MTLNKNLDDLRMDSIRLPSSASPVTTSVSQAFKNGKVIADDGNAFDTVQGAVDAANSIVKIPPETFNESVSVNTAGLTILGSGYDTHIYPSGDSLPIFCQANNVTVSNLSAQTDVNSKYEPFRIGADNITFDSLTARHGGGGGFKSAASQNYKDILFNNCHVGSADSYGIAFGAVNSVCINCTVNNCEDGGISNGENTVIANNIVRNTNGNGMYIGRSDSTVYGNRIHNSSDRGIYANTTDSVIVNNRVSGSTNSSIQNIESNTIVRDNKTSAAN